MAVIEVHDLRKNYGDVEAVRGTGFEVAEGQVFALLGPNGAGKTTTVEILEGYLGRTSGEVSVLGFDPATGGTAFRDRIGIVLQESGLIPVMTVRESIDLYAGYYSRRRSTDELIGLVGLEDKADARVKTLSGGQRRRVDLALALVGDPDLIFLDEPTTGFDPSARRKAWTLVENLAALGKTILLTTHYLDEAQHLADRIAVMGRGQIIAEGTPDSLTDGVAQTRISFALPAGTTTADLPAVSGDVAADDNEVTVTTGAPTADLAAITGWATAMGEELARLEVARPNLEEIYLDIIGEDGRRIEEAS